jgi:hypothetical protein
VKSEDSVTWRCGNFSLLTSFEIHPFGRTKQHVSAAVQPLSHWLSPQSTHPISSIIIFSARDKFLKLLFIHLRHNKVESQALSGLVWSLSDALKKGSLHAADNQRWEGVWLLEVKLEFSLPYQMKHANYMDQMD